MVRHIVVHRKERHSMHLSFSSLRSVRVAAVVLLLFGLVPIPRDTVAQWTVEVRDSTGHGVAGVAIDQHWYDYTLGLEGFRSERTEGDGRLVFPRVRTYRPAAMFLVMASASRTFNVHRVPGRAAGVIGSSWAVQFERQTTGDIDCLDRACVRAPLSVVLTLKQTTDTRRP